MGIEVSPVVKERPKRIRKRPNFDDFEYIYEPKAEKLERTEEITENDIERELVKKDENDVVEVQDWNFSDDTDDDYDITIEQPEEELSPKEVRLEPKDLKLLLSEDSKNIKHKTHCKECKEEFPNRKKLLEHEKESGHYYKFPCKYCPKKFRQKIQAKRHQAQVHSSEM